MNDQQLRWLDEIKERLACSSDSLDTATESKYPIGHIMGAVSNIVIAVTQLVSVVEKDQSVHANPIPEPDFLQQINELRDRLNLLIAATKTARQAIAAVPPEAFGVGGYGTIHWYRKDVLLDQLDKAIARVEGRQ